MAWLAIGNGITGVDTLGKAPAPANAVPNSNLSYKLLIVLHSLLLLGVVKVTPPHY
jgi:hypothetical protein